MRSMQTARKRMSMAQSIKRSLWDWQIEGRMEEEGRQRNCSLKETLVHCAAVEQLLLLLQLRHPLLAALDRGMDPFNVCVDLIYGRLGPATVQGSSPFQINVSDHRQWVDWSTHTLAHTISTSSFSLQFPVYSSSLVSSSRTEWSKTLRLHGWPQLTKRLTTRWTALPDDEVDKNNLCWCRMNCVCECVCATCAN